MARLHLETRNMLDSSKTDTFGGTDFFPTEMVISTLASS